MKRQAKLQTMKRLVEDFHQSGLSPKIFCAQRGLKIHQLHYWRQRLQPAVAPVQSHAGFTMLELKPDKAAYQLAFESGLSMTVTGISPQDMATLLLELNRQHA